MIILCMFSVSTLPLACCWFNTCSVLCTTRQSVLINYSSLAVMSHKYGFTRAWPEHIFRCCYTKPGVLTLSPCNKLRPCAGTSKTLHTHAWPETPWKLYVITPQFKLLMIHRQNVINASSLKKNMRGL